MFIGVESKLELNHLIELLSYGIIKDLNLNYL